MEQYQTVDGTIKMSAFGMHTEILLEKQEEFHKDINSTREVECMMSNPPSEKEVKEGLIEIATDIFNIS